MNEKILVVDDEPDICLIYKLFLVSFGYEVVTAHDIDSAMAAVAEHEFGLIFIDISLGGDSGIDLLRRIRHQGVDAYVIIITGYPDLESAQEALRYGAFDYLSKPVTQETLHRLAKKALDHKSLRDEKERYRRNLEAIFRSVTDGIITVDRQGKILAMNQQAQKLCGIPPDKIGHPMDGSTTHCAHGCAPTLHNVLHDNAENHKEQLTCRLRDGKDQIVGLHASPLLDEGGRSVGAVMVVRDETRMAALERDLKERRRFHGIIGRGPAMQSLYSLVENLATVETTVLITGESGTGKELVAEAIHYHGNRSTGPLVKVNCAALPDTLLESELFGHVRGAFTGALRDKKGRFQLADKGTLFLDEIGDISPNMQTRLLRVLQEKSFERVGDSRTTRVDVRVIAATNQDLRAKIARNQFREDLYYRLKVVEVRLPPLRERRSDIPILCEHFIERFNRKFEKSIRGVSDKVLKEFMELAWPGNIRELEHVLEYAFVVCRKAWIDREDLPPEYRNRDASTAAPPPVASPEREMILKTLQKAGGIKSRAARMLGFSRSTMYRKLRELNISDEEGEHG
ncbi:MAG: sigma 54-interacting transcriptional regulator [Magnetococcales bacterium]|nr:sigma 54-interacting transcriptional regulator [Magnetococcales bacterium]NGZ27441.1 sigma 54-interacting transcriptional regulator [Magnetococcales bacterium]